MFIAGQSIDVAPRTLLVPITLKAFIELLHRRAGDHAAGIVGDTDAGA